MSKDLAFDFDQELMDLFRRKVEGVFLRCLIAFMGIRHFLKTDEAIIRFNTAIALLDSLIDGRKIISGVLRVDPDNIGSWKLFRSLGMKQASADKMEDIRNSLVYLVKHMKTISNDELNQHELKLTAWYYDTFR